MASVSIAPAEAASPSPSSPPPPHQFIIKSNKTTSDSIPHRFAVRLQIDIQAPCPRLPSPRLPPDCQALRSPGIRITSRMEDAQSPPPAKAVLRLAAISGSLRRASANTGLIRAAAEMCRVSIPGMQVDHVDVADLPMLNTDLEVDGGFPPAVQAFRDKIRAADCFLFAAPEYNYSISGPLKNALDWGPRPPNVWGDRAAAILSASGGSGGSRSQYHIRQVGVFLDIHFINKPEVFTKAHQGPAKFDDHGNLIDQETKEQLRKMLLALQAFALRLQLGKAALSASQQQATN